MAYSGRDFVLNIEIKRSKYNFQPLQSRY